MFIQSTANAFSRVTVFHTKTTKAGTKAEKSFQNVINHHRFHKGLIN